MGRKAGFKKKKDPFDALPEGFKEAIEGSDTDEIRKRISDVALLDCTEKGILKNDPDVAQAREELKNLMEPYRENLKSYKLQIQYCKQILDNKGADTTTPIPASITQSVK